MPNRIHYLEADSQGIVKLNGEVLEIKPSQEVRYHSEEFSWGYGGSGPAQLALAVMLHLTGISDGYQWFKWKYIAPLVMDEPFKIMFTDADLVSEE